MRVWLILIGICVGHSLLIERPRLQHQLHHFRPHHPHSDLEANVVEDLARPSQVASDIPPSEEQTKLISSNADVNEELKRLHDLTHTYQKEIERLKTTSFKEVVSQVQMVEKFKKKLFETINVLKVPLQWSNTKGEKLSADTLPHHVSFLFEGETYSFCPVELMDTVDVCQSLGAEIRASSKDINFVGEATRRLKSCPPHGQKGFALVGYNKDVGLAYSCLTFNGPDMQVDFLPANLEAPLRFEFPMSSVPGMVDAKIFNSKYLPEIRNFREQQNPDGDSSLPLEAWIASWKETMQTFKSKNPEFWAEYQTSSFEEDGTNAVDKLDEAMQSTMTMFLLEEAVNRGKINAVEAEKFLPVVLDEGADHSTKQVHPGYLKFELSPPSKQNKQNSQLIADAIFLGIRAEYSRSSSYSTKSEKVEEHVSSDRAEGSAEP